MPEYVTRLRRGGPWDWSRDMRDQAGWQAHAAFMDGLVESGFLLLGGPLAGGRDTLHLVTAASEGEVRERWGADPWAANGMLTLVSIEVWTILLDGIRSSAGRADRGTGVAVLSPRQPGSRINRRSPKSAF